MSDSDMTTAERERLTRKLHAACANPHYADTHWGVCRKVAASIAEARVALLRKGRTP